MQQETSWKRRRWLFYVMAGAAAAAPFVLFATHLRPRENSLRALTFLQDIIALPEHLWQLTTDGVSEMWERYIVHINTATENTTLRSEIMVAKAKIAQLEELKTEVDRLRRHLQLSAHSEPEVVVSEVLTNLYDAPFPLLRIGTGENGGARVGYPVLTGDGVVGRIIRVGKFFSDVQLLTDADFYMDVLLQRTRVRGVLRGTSNGSCLLQLRRRVDVKIGDLVITSGIVGTFPKGMPVGRVMRISYETDNVSQIITVEPWVDIARLDEVIVLKRSSPELEAIAEAAGTEWLTLRPHQSGG